jgi:acetolactate synthase regulatory subunit
MNSATLTTTFDIATDEPAGTLEAVLAIARRGGVQLAALHFAAAGHERRAILTLASDEPDRLDLFLTRLHNVIGVSGITVTAQCRDPLQSLCAMHAACA